MCKPSLCHHSLQHRAPTPRPASTLALLDPQTHIWEGGAGALEPRGDAGCPLPGHIWPAGGSGGAAAPSPLTQLGKVSPEPRSSQGCGRCTGRLMHSACQNILPATHPLNMPSLSPA